MGGLLSQPGLEQHKTMGVIGSSSDPVIKVLQAALVSAGIFFVGGGGGGSCQPALEQHKTMCVFGSSSGLVIKGSSSSFGECRDLWGGGGRALETASVRTTQNNGRI